MKKFPLSFLAYRFLVFPLLTSALVLSGCASKKTMSSTRRHSSIQRVKRNLRPEILSELTVAATPRVETAKVPAAASTQAPTAVPNRTPSLIANSTHSNHGPLAHLALANHVRPVADDTPPVALKKISSLETSRLSYSEATETPLIFDIPVTYNLRVSQWIKYFQNDGKKSFHKWLERSARFIPILQDELSHAGLPQDLIYVAMIESGFRHDAVSHSGAMGLWQFMKPTARRYGLRVEWWIDERKDIFKSTRAAIGYMADLYQQFGSWYLVAASYNMGEGGVRRLIARQRTNNFWDLADRGVLPRETTDYVPKIIAAMLISKAPGLYGFHDLDYQMPMSFEYSNVPGGTNLENLADHLGVSEKYLKDMNPELIRGYVPQGVSGHMIRIPKGSLLAVSQFVSYQSGGKYASKSLGEVSN
jgi:membrane-bound lytic murein transglycosylase D